MFGIDCEAMLGIDMDGLWTEFGIWPGCENWPGCGGANDGVFIPFDGPLDETLLTVRAGNPAAPKPF